MTYSPKPCSVSDLTSLVRFLDDELQSISRAFQEADVLELRETNKEPVRPKEGIIVLADGTNWNPGLGQGLYVRHNNTWNKVTLTPV